MRLASLWDEDVKIEAGDGWVKIRDAIVKDPGPVAVLGGIDTGKSTFLRWLAGELPGTCSFMDLDAGQPDVGLPSCLSFKEDLSDKSDPQLYFTGDFSPSSSTARFLGAIAFLRNLYKDRGHLLINTCGWVDHTSFEYKIAKFRILKPGHFVFIIPPESRSELFYLKKYYARLGNGKIYVLPPSKVIKPRDREERRQRREFLLSRYFEGASRCMKAAKKIIIEGENPLPGDASRGMLLGLLGRSGATLGIGLLCSWEPAGNLEFITPVPIKDVIGIRTGKAYLEIED
ncbi:MAG: hypothetical protein J7M18_07370 [Candidatus Eremiobacteraeota bacterium]|nr:hypothetical protein [Candidatus Eremiobacteraeota bacterium]